MALIKPFTRRDLIEISMSDYYLHDDPEAQKFVSRIRRLGAPAAPATEDEIGELCDLLDKYEDEL